MNLNRLSITGLEGLKYCLLDENIFIILSRIITSFWIYTIWIGGFYVTLWWDIYHSWQLTSYLCKYMSI